MNLPRYLSLTAELKLDHIFFAQLLVDHWKYLGFPTEFLVHFSSHCDWYFDDLEDLVA